MASPTISPLPPFPVHVPHRNPSEMMARLMVAAGRMKDKKRKINAACVPYASSGEAAGSFPSRSVARSRPQARRSSALRLAFSALGEVTVAQLPVSLGIAADGMVVVPNTGLVRTQGLLPRARARMRFCPLSPSLSHACASPPPFPRCWAPLTRPLAPRTRQPPDPSKPPEIIFYHSMPMISIAAGGDAETYNLVCYVAKDDTGRREAYIFDCEEHSDEVLATLGQSFVLAQDFAAKKRAKPDKEKLKKEYLDVEAVYDTATDLSAMVGGFCLDF